MNNDNDVKPTFVSGWLKRSTSEEEVQETDYDS